MNCPPHFITLSGHRPTTAMQGAAFRELLPSQEQSQAPVTPDLVPNIEAFISNQTARESPPGQTPDAPTDRVIRNSREKHLLLSISPADHHVGAKEKGYSLKLATLYSEEEIYYLQHGRHSGVWIETTIPECDMKKLTPNQRQVLKAIVRSESPTYRDIACVTGLPTRIVIRALHRLMLRGYRLHYEPTAPFVDQVSPTDSGR